ncbi:putative iron-regulated membrane protein [Candidatus Nitrotoga sp. HW29]|uniref:PepSY-associated TM helix domain-containing protein n=1 Tax=Candidatus Nitrotoga sp. HW29 TaxID=2886963 RepID=UPI001EF1A2B7|nr:PepSY-associated TM helix domain-containing protein [Candidatus Nitrotoga sp. HW29]CAH1903819.1 putative iron-regulated membrane protein [Candidatus Nitrotoga sp. HW29]
MRRVFGLLHRWAGLLIAGFLLVSGLTGAVISWDHELDDWLNPHLMEAKSAGTVLPVLDMVKQIETRHSQVRVTFLPLKVEPGESLHIGVQSRVDPATGKLHVPGFNQVFIDPATGEELGKRQWGTVWPITKETFVSFLYRLHYTLHIPELWGIDRWGHWLLGIIAIVWTIDCFVGFYLTLPAQRRASSVQTIDDIGEDVPVPVARSFWQRWKPMWKVRWRGGSTKLNFDLHRAFSLWTWILLFIIAFTAFSLNLYREVFFPAISLVSKVTPSPFDQRTRTPKHEPIEPRLGFGEILERARADATSRDWKEPAGSVSYSPNFGVYTVQFFALGADHGAGGVGHPRLYYDGQDGHYLGDRQPWTGTAADIFVQAQFPLHSGRILGLPGRILISIMGLVVVMLSVTGVVIWWRKRKARTLALTRFEVSSSRSFRTQVGQRAAYER